MIDVERFNEGGRVQGYTDAPFAEALRGCTACSRAGAVILGEGPADAEFMFLAATPTQDDLQRRLPLMGKAGVQFDEWLVKLGLRRDRVLVTYLAKCFQPYAPKATEIGTCTKWLAPEMAYFGRVRVIIPLGKAAAKTVLNGAEQPAGLRCHWATVKCAGRELHVLPLPAPTLRTASDKTEMSERVLPGVVEYFTRYVPEEYARAALVR